MKIFKRILKITLLLLALVLFDLACSNRKVSEMPPITGERIVSLYTIYNPMDIKPTFYTLKDTANNYLEENVKSDSITFLQKFAAYAHGLERIHPHQRLVLITPICLLLFVIACFFFAIVLKRTRLNITLEEKTSKGTVLKQ